MTVIPPPSAVFFMLEPSVTNGGIPEREDAMRLQWDNKISTGHLLTAGAMIIAGLSGYFDLRGSQVRVIADVVAMHRAAEEQEARIRAVEIAQAGQSSDLRAIQIALSRIEAGLEKLQPKP